MLQRLARAERIGIAACLGGSRPSSARKRGRLIHYPVALVVGTVAFMLILLGDRHLARTDSRRRRVFGVAVGFDALNGHAPGG